MTSFWHPSTNQFLFLVLWHAFSYVCQPSSQSLSNKGLFCNLKPIPTRLCHMIYCCSDKSYPCLVGIGLTSTFCFRVNPIPTKLCHMIYCHREKLSLPSWNRVKSSDSLCHVCNMDVESPWHQITGCPRLFNLWYEVFHFKISNYRTRTIITCS